MSHVRQRLCLYAISGGFGLTSMESVSVAAFLGAVALALPAGQRFLPVDCDLAVAYSDAHMLMAQQRVLEPMGLLTVGAIAGNLRLQQKITQAGRAARLQAALATAPHNSYRAHLLSQATAEASAWLLANPGKCFHLMLINDDFKFAARQWLGFSVVSLFCPHRNRGDNHIHCLACSPLHLEHVPSTDITNNTGDHGFKCAAGGQAVMAVGGFKSRRHNGVVRVLADRLRTYSRWPAGQASIDVEPYLLAHHGVHAVPNHLLSTVTIVLTSSSRTLMALRCFVI